MFVKVKHGIVSLIAGIFFIAYVCLLIPAFVYMPILGLLAFSSDTMTVLGGIVCVLGMLTVPFSMGVSLYFISTNHSQRKYLKVLFFCMLPIILLLLSLAFMNLIVQLHSDYFA